MNNSSGVKKESTRYCYRFCENHPHVVGDKATGYLACICIDGKTKYSLNQEHSRGRPYLKRKDCPFLILTTTDIECLVHD